MLMRVADELRQGTFDGSQQSQCEQAAKILHRTAPDITAAWLMDNADTTEITEVFEALREVSGRPGVPGEAPAPQSQEKSTP